MNENINLCELLKGHEGETFYTPLVGNVKLLFIEPKQEFCIVAKIANNSLVTFTKFGKYSTQENTECVLFPSKEQRDWNKWIEEQKNKPIKTWNDYVNIKYGKRIKDNDLINKSVLAFSRICKLISITYGGIPTMEERMNENNCVYVPIYNNDYDYFDIIEAFEYLDPIAFRTDLDCSEFLSYPENVQLLKDYYML